MKKRKQFYGGGGTYKPNFKKPTATPQTNRGHESDAFGNIDGVGMPINVPFGGGGSSGLIGNYGSMEDMRARLPPEVMANLKAKGEKFSKMTPAEMRQVNTDSVAKRKQDEKNAAAAEVARESAERLKSYNANKAYKEKRDAATRRQDVKDAAAAKKAATTEAENKAADQRVANAAAGVALSAREAEARAVREAEAAAREAEAATEEQASSTNTCLLYTSPSPRDS